MPRDKETKNHGGKRTRSEAPSARDASGDRHLLLWDGDCGFCRHSVEWVAEHDTEGKFQIVHYQKAPDPPVTPALREACKRAVHVITSDGRVLRAGRAGLFVLQELGHTRSAALLGRRPFVWLVESGYRTVAANRTLFDRVLFRSRKRKE